VSWRRSAGHSAGRAGPPPSRWCRSCRGRLPRRGRWWWCRARRWCHRRSPATRRDRRRGRRRGCRSPRDRSRPGGLRTLRRRCCRRRQCPRAAPGRRPSRSRRPRGRAQPARDPTQPGSRSVGRAKRGPPGARRSPDRDSPRRHRGGPAGAAGSWPRREVVFRPRPRGCSWARRTTTAPMPRPSSGR
jgi:hypothetical protein